MLLRKSYGRENTFTNCTLLLKNISISGLTQFKFMLPKGHLYVIHKNKLYLRVLRCG